MTRDHTAAVAGFWNRAAADFDAIYTGAGKTKFARALDCCFRRDMYQRFDWVMDRTGDVRYKSICDVGCGSGRFVDEFVRRGAARVIGIDVAPEMLKLAQGLVESAGRERQCEFVSGDILDWKTDRIFDTTVAIGLWDYVADPRERLAVIRGFTRGTFLSAWPRFWTWRMPIRKLRLQYLRGCPVSFFRAAQVRRLLEGADFEVVRFETIGKLFCVEARTP